MERAHFEKMRKGDLYDTNQSPGHVSVLVTLMNVDFYCNYYDWLIQKFI